jgi:hypothetical protein
MWAQDIGLQPLIVDESTLKEIDDSDLYWRCQATLLACQALRPWLYEDGPDWSCIGGPLVDWLDDRDQLGEHGAEGLDRDIDQAVEDFPSEVQDCNRLLMPILDAGRAKGLDDDDLFECTWLMMSPFLTGRESSPTEADWQKKKVTLILKRAVKADEDRQFARQDLERSIRDSLAKDREYTLGLILGILAEVKDTIES